MRTTYCNAAMLVLARQVCFIITYLRELQDYHQLNNDITNDLAQAKQVGDLYEDLMRHVWVDPPGDSKELDKSVSTVYGGSFCVSTPVMLSSS